MDKTKQSNTGLKKHSVELYWIPLGAGAHIVRSSGKIFEAISALVQRRYRQSLYHSALQIFTPEGRYVIEQTPVLNNPDKVRGVVAEGPVGMKILGRLPVFRYEVRCWKEGNIPDLHFAVGPPATVTEDAEKVQKILENIQNVPTLIWGRDELNIGDMWNSNSVVSWVLEQSDIDTSNIFPPNGGRAPGWQAGVTASRRQ